MTIANVNIRRVLLKRGNTIQSNSYTGPIGEVTMDTDIKTIRIHDGLTAGGHLIPTQGNMQSYANVAVASGLAAVNANVATLATNVATLTTGATAANTAMKSYVDSQITSIVGGAPTVLDTLGEIATALNNDANVAATLTNSIAAVNGNVANLTTNVSSIAGNITTINNTLANITVPNLQSVTTDIIPATDIAYDIGSLTNRFRDIYLSTNTIYLGTNAVGIDASGQLVISESYQGGEGVGDIASVEWTTSSNLEIRTSDTSSFVAKFDSLKNGDTFELLTGSVSFPADTVVTVNGTVTKTLDGSGDYYDFVIPVDVASQSNVYVYNFTLTKTPLTDVSQLSDTGSLLLNFSGDYNDLTNKPTIPADVSDLTDTTNLLDGFSGDYNDLTNITGSSGPENIAIGREAHLTFTYTPGFGTVAIGYAAGRDNQGGHAVAIGWQAGQNNQSNTAIAIGYAAGQTGQEDGAVAIGAFAGNQFQGADAIAIGKYAGFNGVGVAQPDNTIFLNATGTNMGGVAAQTNSFYVAPIRDAAATAKGLFYNTTTKEITTANLATVATSGSYSDLSGTPATYTDANVSTFLTAFGSNSISTTGNVSATSFIGDGSQLTGLPASYSDSDVATFLAAFGSNSISTTGNITAGNISGNITITGNVTGTSANVELVAGSYTWSFDNTGNLTLPGNTFSVNYANGTAVTLDRVYLLEAYANVTYTLPGSFTEDPCRYSIVSSNVNVSSSWFDTSTYTFTPQKAGYWEITASYDVYRNSEASLAIKKNNSIVAAAGGFNAVAQQVTKIIYLNGSTDYINIVNVGGAALGRAQYDSRSWFQARWVGE